MAGLKVVSVKVLSNGALDLEDLRSKAESHKDNLAAFMVRHHHTLNTLNCSLYSRSHILPHSAFSKTVSRKLARSYMTTEDKSTWMVCDDVKRVDWFYLQNVRRQSERADRINQPSDMWRGRLSP